MTSRKQELSERLQREFDVCDRHVLRINEALNDFGVQVPMTYSDYEKLTSEHVRCLDQFIFRFSKLQDVLGAKIFRYTLELLDEDVQSLPMRDILNRMERYSLIPSADEWGYIRELRNDIAHDYPLTESDMVSVLNELISKADVLISIYNKLKQRISTELSTPTLFS